MIDIRLIRIIVCVPIGLYLISIGIESEIFGILTTAMGLLFIIYAFSPRLAKNIIKAIKDIATAPFKR